MKELGKFRFFIIAILIILVVVGCGTKKKTINEVNDLANSNVGVYASSEYDRIIESYVPSAVPKYYSSYADQISALKSGKIDGFLTDEPLAKEILKETSGLKVLEGKLTEDSYAFAISPAKKDLQVQINKVMEEMEKEGLYKKFEDKWMGSLESKKVLEKYDYEPVNGTVVFGTVSTIVPFSYVKDNEVVGYDIDVIKYVCYKLKYKLEIVEMAFDGIIPSLVSNKIDVAGASIIVTEERKKSVLFSNPDYTGGIVVVVRAE